MESIKGETATIYRPKKVTEEKVGFWKIVFRSIILLAVIVPFFYAICQYMSAPHSNSRNKGSIQIPLNRLPEGASHLVLYHGLPVMVVNSHGKIKAVSALCTIGDSILQWDKEREELVCTTYGARFDLNGNVIAGLAPRPLACFKVIVTEDTVVIDKLL